MPTLGRHTVLGALAANVAATTPPGTYQLLFVCDHGDTRSQAAVRAARYCRYIRRDGSYPHKTNAGVSATDAPLLLPTADDVRFHEGWLPPVLSALADERVQVIGTDDLSPMTRTRGHATMPVLRRSYVEDPGAAWREQGTIFHEGYAHNFVETELWQLANHRGVTGWGEGTVIEHLHPAWGKREVDSTDHKGNLTGFDADQALFEQRRRAWQSEPSQN